MGVGYSHPWHRDRGHGTGRGMCGNPKYPREAPGTALPSNPVQEAGGPRHTES